MSFLVRLTTVLAVVGVVGCQSNDGPSTDSESHFLDFRPCTADTECAEGLRCICGMCTTPCEEGDVCGDADTVAACEADSSVLGETCAAEASAGDVSATCLSPCETDEECRAIDLSYVCVTGYCSPQPSCEALGDPPGDTVVDLGDEGLTDGAVIDTFLETHLVSGNEVHVPEGTYTWNGGGLGADLADASLIGDGDVTFDTGGGHAWNATFSSSGAFELRDITIAGEGGAAGKIRVEGTTPESVLTFRDFDQPDGSVDGTRSGIYVVRSHAGTAYFYDVDIEGFGDGGLVAYSPGQSDGGDGAVHVIGGLFRNNNIANINLGSSGSTITRAVSIQDGPSPTETDGGINQRGIRVRQTTTGENLRIEDVDLIQQQGGNGALVVEGDPGGSGVIRDVRIQNDIDQPPIQVRNDDSTWEVEGVDVTGTEALEPEGVTVTELCTGAECQAPRDSAMPTCH